MKFAQSLEEHLVPEWRAQYLDYKKGKKKLKKLVKKPSVMDSRSPCTSSTGTPAQVQLHKISNSNLANNGNRPISKSIQESPQEGNGNYVETASKTTDIGNSLYKSPSNREDQLTLSSTQNSHSFALPEPAIMPDSRFATNSPNHLSASSGNSEDNDYSSKNNSKDNKKPHDKTPLLSSNQKNDSSPFNQYYNTRRQSTVSRIFDSLKNSPSISGLKSRKSITGANDTELEDLSYYARQQFLAWVDDELNKVEMFYKEKENSYIERFLILQDQLNQLEDQKMRSKKRWQRMKQLRHAHFHDTEQHDQNEEHNQNYPHDRNDQHDRYYPYDNDDEDYYDDDDDEDEDDDFDVDLALHSDAHDQWYEHLMFDSAKRNIKFFSFWTRRKLRIINKFDMPSLPTFEWLKKDGKVEKQYYEDGYYSDDDSDVDNNHHNNNIENSNTKQIQSSREASNLNYNRRDYSRKKIKSQQQIPSPTFPYFVARRMLKKAVYEFYRSMELLKSYRLINRTAFRKLIKKYDKTTHDTMLIPYMKKVDDTYFTKSDVLDNLMTKVEEMFTRYFENGNRKIAITKLRSSVAERTYYFVDYLSGLLVGFGVPIFIFTLYLALHRTLSGDLPEGKYLLQIWGGFFIITLMGLLFSINCYVWNVYKVNYKFIFEFNQRDALDYKQYMVIPSLLFFLGCLIAWFSFEDFWTIDFNGRDFPWIFLAICMVLFLCPFDVLYLNARVWLLSTLIRLMFSGFYPVEFRDFFIGDIFCSMTYSISNLSMFFCLYGTHWNNCLDGSGTSSCGSSKSRLLGFLQCLPSIWRFLQCFRRYADTGDWFPHLANMGKYSVSTLYYMSLSLYRIETVPKYLVLLIFWGSFNSVFSAIWDLLMDWSLFQFDSENFLLRDELIFKNKSVYYVSMITDVILRFQWIFYALFTTQIQQSAVTSFGVAVAEIIRRFIWIFFRMENEHATNVHLFRASRESPLPFPTLFRKTSPRKPTFASYDITEQSKPLDNESIPAVTSGYLQTPQLTHTYPHAHGDIISNMYRRGTVDNTNNEINGAESTTSEANGGIGRYMFNLSKILMNAHIKDFQRRKITKKQKDDGDRVDGVEDGNDTDEDLEEEEEAEAEAETQSENERN